jgi:hypothetical protein
VPVFNIVIGLEYSIKLLCECDRLDVLSKLKALRREASIFSGGLSHSHRSFIYRSIQLARLQGLDWAVHLKFVLFFEMRDNKYLPFRLPEICNSQLDPLMCWTFPLTRISGNCMACYALANREVFLQFR